MDFLGIRALHHGVRIYPYLEAVGGAGLWQVEVDPSQMEAMILNLVVNAKDAMAGSGKLTIETGDAFIDRALAAECRHAGRTIRADRRE